MRAADLPWGRYRHLIWDWNGTLLDDTWLCVAVLNDLLASIGRRAIDEPVYRAHFGFPVIDFYAWLGFDVAGEGFARISERFIAGYYQQDAQCALQAQAAAVLTLAQARGWRHSVLSAQREDNLIRQVERVGLSPHFACLNGTSTIHATGKVERGQGWMARQDLSPAGALMIGDTVHDWDVAQAMGVDCLLVAHGHQAAARLAATGAPVVADLGELHALWSRLP